MGLRKEGDLNGMDLPSNADDKVDLGFGRNVEVTRSPRSSLQSDFLLLLGKILFYIRFSPLEDYLAFCLCCL